MKLAKILAFDRELLDDSPDTDNSVFVESTIKLEDIREFEEDVVEAA